MFGGAPWCEVVNKPRMIEFGFFRAGRAIFRLPLPSPLPEFSLQFRGVRSDLIQHCEEVVFFTKKQGFFFICLKLLNFVTAKKCVLVEVNSAIGNNSSFHSLSLWSGTEFATFVSIFRLEAKHGLEDCSMVLIFNFFFFFFFFFFYMV